MNNEQKNLFRTVNTNTMERPVAVNTNTMERPVAVNTNTGFEQNVRGSIIPMEPERKMESTEAPNPALESLKQFGGMIGDGADRAGGALARALNYANPITFSRNIINEGARGLENFVTGFEADKIRGAQRFRELEKQKPFWGVNGSRPLIPSDPERKMESNQGKNKLSRFGSPDMSPAYDKTAVKQANKTSNVNNATLDSPLEGPTMPEERLLLRENNNLVDNQYMKDYQQRTGYIPDAQNKSYVPLQQRLEQINKGTEAMTDLFEYKTGTGKYARGNAFINMPTPVEQLQPRRAFGDNSPSAKTRKLMQDRAAHLDEMNYKYNNMASSNYNNEKNRMLKEREDDRRFSFDKDNQEFDRIDKRNNLNSDFQKTVGTLATEYTRTKDPQRQQYIVNMLKKMGVSMSDIYKNPNSNDDDLIKSLLSEKK